MIVQAAAGYGRIFLPAAEFFWWPGRIIFPGVGNTLYVAKIPLGGIVVKRL